MTGRTGSPFGCMDLIGDMLAPGRMNTSERFCRHVCRHRAVDQVRLNRVEALLVES